MYILFYNLFFHTLLCSGICLLIISSQVTTKPSLLGLSVRKASTLMAQGKGCRRHTNQVKSSVHRLKSNPPLFLFSVSSPFTVDLSRARFDCIPLVLVVTASCIYFPSALIQLSHYSSITHLKVFCTIWETEVSMFCLAVYRCVCFVFCL